MKYYRVQEGHDLRHPDGTVTRGGEVVALATDSKDKRTRKGAIAVLSGNWEIVTETEKPKASSKKKATYKTTEATPEK